MTNQINYTKILEKSHEIARTANTKIMEGADAYANEAIKGVAMRANIKLDAPDTDVEALKRDSLLDQMNLVTEINTKLKVGNLDYLDRNISDLRELQNTKLISYAGLHQAEIDPKYQPSALEKEIAAGSGIVRKMRERLR